MRPAAFNNSTVVDRLAGITVKTRKKKRNLMDINNSDDSDFDDLGPEVVHNTKFK